MSLASRNPFNFPNVIRTATATINNGASLSDIVETNGLVPVGLIMPSAWTAADLTFQACDTKTGTFVNVYDSEDAELTVQAAASRYIALDPTKFLGMPFLRIRSGTSGAAVNQGGARAITVILRPG